MAVTGCNTVILKQGDDLQRSMPFKEHPAFKQPDNSDLPIWRFVDHSKFIWILQESALYFAQTDKLSDPYEGLPPVDFLREHLEQLKEMRDNLNEQLSSEKLPPVTHDRVLAPYEHFRKSFYVNCGHESEYESVAMWKLYLSSGDGVAIKTTYEDLVESLDPHDEYDFHAGIVEYVDYDSSESIDNLIRAHMMKQQEYDFEKEVRVAVHNPPPPKKGELEPGDLVEFQYNRQSPGFPIEVDLDSLIEEVRISPYSPPWVTQDYWEDIIGKYEYDIEVTVSDVTTPPSELI